MEVGGGDDAGDAGGDESFDVVFVDCALVFEGRDELEVGLFAGGFGADSSGDGEVLEDGVFVSGLGGGGPKPGDVGERGDEGFGLPTPEVVAVGGELSAGGEEGESSAEDDAEESGEGEGEQPGVWAPGVEVGEGAGSDGGGGHEGNCTWRLGQAG